jgi:hypothetical protein
MITRANANGTRLAVYGPLYKHCRHSPILAMLPYLSTTTKQFLTSYDLGCCAELVVWLPRGCDAVMLFRSRGFFLRFFSRVGLRYIRRLSRPCAIQMGYSEFPLIRKQTYKFSSFFFFSVTRILPDGTVSGRFLFSTQKSAPRRSSFTTFIPLVQLSSPAVIHVFIISRTYSWEVVWTCDPVCLAPPSNPLATRFLVDAPLVRPLLSKLLECLREAVSFFLEDITPNHMSSDASFDHGAGLPYLVFDAIELARETNPRSALAEETLPGDSYLHWLPGHTSIQVGQAQLVEPPLLEHRPPDHG